MHCRGDGVLCVEVARAAVTRPSVAIGAVEARCVQGAAGVYLERVHHSLGGFVGTHHYMDVVAADVSGKQRPGSVLADFF
jgi:hypothetical protein